MDAGGVIGGTSIVIGGVTALPTGGASEIIAGAGVAISGIVVGVGSGMDYVIRHPICVRTGPPSGPEVGSDPGNAGLPGSSHSHPISPAGGFPMQ